MDDFKILEEIGLKEVSNRTHIEVKNLEYMLNSQFSKLNRASTVGFVKILSREYGLDLTDWLNEAQRFWSENRGDESAPKIFIVQKQKNFLRGFLTILFVFILAIILYGAYMFLNNKLDFFENPLVKADANYTYEETPVVNEAKETLEENMTQDEINSTMGADINQTIGVKLDEQNSSEVNTTVQSLQDINTSGVVKNIVKQDKIDKETLKKRDDYISPNRKLWIGIIYLDNFKRKSYLGKQEFSLDASRNQLITTGHGNFNLYFNGEIKKFHSQKPIRLFIEDGKIFTISDDRFKKLNRGSLW